ncbi:MAG: class I SAM-dependent methyltransferase [Enterobacteriaceae bacterium]|jgi:2-polyprenyl-3-methyl-5-hydroxy-6-metoxy-1,4-benzoquinol methylase|nr:class I SAM-dependent methyltransferase [Enterobacteriaceae bacterium]
MIVGPMGCNMSNKISTYQDILKHAFNLHYINKSDVWTRDIGMRILPLLVKGRLRFGTETRILDIGCGSGLDAQIYSSLCHSVVGIDLFSHPEWIDIMKNFNNVTFKNGDFLSMDKLSENYHIIIDNGCFHHQQASDWSVYLAKIEQLLNVTGTLVLSTFFDEQSATYIDSNQRIHHYLSNKDLINLMQKYNFRVIDNIYIYRQHHDNYYRISFCRKRI